MAKAIHTMVRVLDLDRSIDFYSKAFGLDVAAARFFGSSSPGTIQIWLNDGAGTLAAPLGFADWPLR